MTTSSSWSLLFSEVAFVYMQRIDELCLAGDIDCAVEVVVVVVWPEAVGSDVDERDDELGWASDVDGRLAVVVVRPEAVGGDVDVYDDELGWSSVILSHLIQVEKNEQKQTKYCWLILV